MPADTKQKITQLVLQQMATQDPTQISMRQVAELAGIQASVIYHYYESKEALLKAAFLTAQQRIREALQALPEVKDVHQLMQQRIKYHLDNGDLIIPMLRYFMTFKQAGSKEPGSYIPPQAYYHIQEAIDRGIEEKIYESHDSNADARVIVHALNGFVLEYYPHTALYNDTLVDTILNFVERALRKEVTISD